MGYLIGSRLRKVVRPIARLSKKWRKRIGSAVAALLLLEGGWVLGRYQAGLPFLEWLSSPGPPNERPLSGSLKLVSVMVVGGSAAHGYDDPNTDSYIRRAFQDLTDSTNTMYEYIDMTQSGEYETQIDTPSRFPAWLKINQPDIVVLSFGLLTTIHDKVPFDKFAKAIHDEVSEALKAHAVVLCVTPLVVQASATYYSRPFHEYLNVEHRTVDSFHSRNVYWFDVHREMNAYMQAHGQTWLQYYGDSWHPNEAGHVLGGELLRNQLIKTFGSATIAFRK